MPTTVMPTTNEMRAPASTRARMSRPSSSRPNGCANVGPASLAGRSCADGSKGAMNGPTTAATAAIATMTVPTVRSGDRLLIPDPGIEESVRDVHDDVHRNVRDRDQQDASLYRGIVARADRLDEQTANARPREN